MLLNISDRVHKRVVELEKKIVRDQLGELDPVSFEPILSLSCLLLAQQDLSCIAYLTALNNLIVKHLSQKEKALLSVLQTASLRLQGFAHLEFPEFELDSHQAILVWLVRMLYDYERLEMFDTSFLDKVDLHVESEASFDVFLISSLLLNRAVENPRFPVLNEIVKFLETNCLKHLTQADLEAIRSAKRDKLKLFFLNPETAIETMIVEHMQNPSDCDTGLIKRMSEYILKHRLNDTLAHDLGVLAGVVDLKEDAINLLEYALLVRTAIHGEDSIESKQTQQALNLVRGDLEIDADSAKSLQDVGSVHMPERDFLQMCINLIDKGEIDACRDKLLERLLKC